MTEQSNDKRKNNNCQDSTSISGHLKAVNPPEKPAESDDTPFPPTELLLDWVIDLIEHLPAGEVLVPLLLKGLRALQATPAIAERLHTIGEGIDALCDVGERIVQGQDKQIELWQETNQLLRDIKENPWATTKGSRPFKPPSQNEPGGRYEYS